MKINWLKCIFAFVASVLVGLLCFEISGAEPQKWVSMAVSLITSLVCLVSAMGFDMSDIKKVNIKVNAWTFTIMVILTNVIFAFFAYDIIIYIVVVGLLVLLDVVSTYVLYHRQ